MLNLFSREKININKKLSLHIRHHNGFGYKNKIYYLILNSSEKVKLSVIVVLNNGGNVVFFILRTWSCVWAAAEEKELFVTVTINNSERKL